ncbi:excinuclease ABC subunit UvrC, partial [Desulfovibrio sp. OttesenSCG-928-I05]|nr:excinuclease ABC subunit UvrC [Desulfovibrio sp. OttesenSCG-928-I05]
MERPSPKTLPQTPGVYLYKDDRGRIIYVGKAKNLRKRILSYFGDKKGISDKTRAMLAHAESIETLTTATEKEAFLLEASLIKKHRPRYNIVLRDDKDYILFRLKVRDEFPRLEIVRRLKPGRDKGVLLFGPYSSAMAARETWQAVQQAFPLRRCSDRFFKNRVRPCLYHHMGRCLGPCTLPVDKERYADLVRQVALLLQGHSAELLASIRESMMAASDALDFEMAAKLRDRAASVERTLERQVVVLDSAKDMDVLGIAATDDGLGLGILFVRQGVLLDKRVFFWPGLDLDDAPELLESFLLQFYRQGLPVPPRIVSPWLAHGAIRLAREELGPAAQDEAGSGSAPEEAATASGDVPGDAFGEAPCASPGTLHESQESEEPEYTESAEPADAAEAGDAAALAPQAAPSPGDNIDVIEALLSEARGGIVRLTGPRDASEDALVSMATANAREGMRPDKNVSMAESLARVLHAPKPLERIEAVDVSHTGGRATRVGMVVFEGGRPLKSAYRSYAVEAGGDDYAALTLWAQRRAASGEPWPDLLLIDGGKGQLAAVHRAFSEAGAGDAFFMASIAKARDEEGRADRRSAAVEDRIFLPGRSNPLPIAAGSAELFFLQHIRDSVHDFSIGRH